MYNLLKNKNQNPSIRCMCVCVFFPVVLYLYFHVLSLITRCLHVFFSLLFFFFLSITVVCSLWSNLLTMRSMRLLLLHFCVTQIDCVNLSGAHEVSLMYMHVHQNTLTHTYMHRPTDRHTMKSTHSYLVTI